MVGWGLLALVFGGDIFEFLACDYWGLVCIEFLVCVWFVLSI